MAITCPCYWVSPTGSILLGGIAGVIVVLGVELLEWLRIDDPIGAVPVHGICGIWGTLSLGFFACGKYGATGPFAADNSAPLKGLFYGGGTQVLMAQADRQRDRHRAPPSRSRWPSCTLVNAMGLLRVSQEGEAARSRSARARHFGLSGVCHLGHRQTGGNGHRRAGQGGGPGGRERVPRNRGCRLERF